MQQVPLGIIGCGVIGDYHLRAATAASHIRVTALADLRVESAQRKAQEFAGIAADLRMPHEVEHDLPGGCKVGMLMVA